MANISFLNTCLLTTLGTDIFYNKYLYMRSVIVYNILNA